MSDAETHAALLAQPGRALAAIGLSEAEEAAYLVLLENPGASLPELADLLGLPSRRAGRILTALEGKGMLTRSPGREAGFQPTPPEAAVEALIAQRERELNSVRWHAERLAEQASAAALRGSSQEFVELVTGAESVAACWERLHASAQREGMVIVNSARSVAGLRWPEDAATRLEIRTIYDRNGLEHPGTIDQARAQVSAGERARVFSPLPVEISIVDRAIAMMPLLAGVTDGVALVVRPCAWLDALVALFEAIWERAAAVSFSPAGGIAMAAGDRANLPVDVERILPLLVAGLRDDCVAREVGLSARTLDRRIRAMMRSWGAATRFQAGWLAAARYQPPDHSGSRSNLPRLQD